MKPLLFFILFAYSTVIAQRSEKLPAENSRWLIGANYSVDYCSRELKAADNNETALWIMDLRDEYEEGRRGYTTGLSVNYLFSTRFSAETGVFYSVKGYQHKKLELTFGDMTDPRFGFSFGDQSYPGFTVDGILYSFNYIDVPFKLIYSPGKRKTRFIGGAGLAVNFFLKATRTFTYGYADGSHQDITNEQPYDFNKINLSAFASAGVEYRHGKVRLRLEPAARYGLLKIINAPLTSYLWSAGANISCFYSLQ